VKEGKFMKNIFMVILMLLVISACGKDGNQGQVLVDGSSDSSDDNGETTPPLPRVILGARSSCVLLGPKDLKCWGKILNNQNLTTPTSVIEFTNDYSIKDLALGSAYSCILTTEGSVKCLNSWLSQGTLETVSGLEAGVTKINGYYHNFCALMDSGSVKCWEFSSGNAVVTDIKVGPTDLLSNAKDIFSGGGTSCAILNNNKLMCWGILDGWSTTLHNASEVLTDVLSVSVGGYGFCALLTTGGVKCQGAFPGLGGDPGDPSTIWMSETPVTPIGLESGVVAVSSGYNFHCALLDTGVVKCWGSVNSGELGTDSVDSVTQLAPGPVEDLSGAISLSSSSNHSCVLINESTLKCWGDNYDGQIGDGQIRTEIGVPFEISF
jgi:hypothetical protein